jgi:molybdopterin synthase catalytic subunit
MSITIGIQTADFSVQQECDALRALSKDIGAIVSFCGLVRELHDGATINGLFLEHYPGMTEKSLQSMAEQACSRWPLQGVTIIHRVGQLLPAEQIVLVVVASAHRAAAFAACDFLMDYLKTKAPFWKKCAQGEQQFWVEAKDSDLAASQRW